VLGAVLGWFLWWRCRPKDDDTSTTTDQAADQAVKDTNAAIDAKDQALKELEQKHGEKLATMTEEQRKEFEEVKKKDVDEVATWIDNL
jgi:DNA anti-recombination protein RmuC